MKRIATILLLVCCATLLPRADAVAQIGITKGLKAGANIATFRVDESLLDVRSRSGFVAGAFVRIDLPGALVLQPEVLYSQKGMTTKDIDNDDIEIHVDYLEVPVLLKVKAPFTGPASGHIFGGGAIAFELNEEIRAAGEVSTDRYKDTDYAVVIGAGLDVELPVGVLVTDLRLTLGLDDIRKTNTGGSVKNGAFSVMIGFGF